MSAPIVGQAELLADVFANALNEFRPASLAVIGCAGGNGFDRIHPLEVTRIVGVDINPSYLEVAYSRYSGRFRDFQLHCSDIAQVHLEIEPVELVYAALVFEYVDIPSALRNLYLACCPGGYLVTLLQLPSDVMAPVTPTAFARIQTLSAVLKLVDPVAFDEMAQNTGFVLQHSKRITSGTGKEFAVHVFQRPWARK